LKGLRIRGVDLGGKDFYKPPERPCGRAATKRSH
jgi:hypothetical protein